MQRQSFVEFQKGGPFYDLVGAFLIAISSSPAIFNEDNPMGLTSEQYVTISAVVGDTKHLYPFDVFREVRQGHLSMPTFLVALCTMLTNAAYESVKAQNDHSPEFEFFRHLRNASSHGNRFTFLPGEPRRPASWRGIGFDHTLKGASNPLHDSPCFGPLYGPADLIDLLFDIEQKLLNKSDT